MRNNKGSSKTNCRAQVAQAEPSSLQCIRISRPCSVCQFPPRQSRGKMKQRLLCCLILK